jgi:mRNA-degrading endonuclease toxin of MazEF toxin-antitoxin module
LACFLTAGLTPWIAAAGVIFADHVRSIDWRARHAERVGEAADETLAKVLGTLTSLLADS